MERDRRQGICGWCWPGQHACRCTDDKPRRWARSQRGWWGSCGAGLVLGLVAGAAVTLLCLLGLLLCTLQEGLQLPAGGRAGQGTACARLCCC